MAPAAHGGNRTGRVFTGDRSGDWLYGALYRAGERTNQSRGAARAGDDGLRLEGAYVTAVVCRALLSELPLPEERDNRAKVYSTKVSWR